jgi:hypothetical protein
MSRSDEPMTVILSPEISARIRGKMLTFGYSDPVQVIEEGLSVLDPQEEEFQRFLTDEAIPALEEYDRDPSTGRTSGQVRESLEAEYLRLVKAG